MNYINYSGGANGADTEWHMIGLKYGFKKHVHWREPNMRSVDSNVLRINGVSAKPCTQEDYDEGIKVMINVAKVLKRNLSKKYAHYQYRNWLQVKYADAVFAVSSIINNQVEGGTGYACHAAIIELQKPVYVFDKNVKHWFEYSYETNQFEPCDTPTLTPAYAGIGSRDIDDDCKEAIRNVYQKTIDLNQNK